MVEYTWNNKLLPPSLSLMLLCQSILPETENKTKKYFILLLRYNCRIYKVLTNFHNILLALF